MATLPSFPIELHLNIISMVDQPTLAALARTSSAFYKPCVRRLWQHLEVLSPKDLAIMIFAIKHNPQLASFVESVTFTCDADSMKAHTNHVNEDCLHSCCHILQKGTKDILAEVWKGRKDADAITAGKLWSAVESLPQELLGLLDTHALHRSYALPQKVDDMWYDSFAAGLRASTTLALRCLSAEGSSLYQLSPEDGIVKPYALHLYGTPSDWTLYESPNKPAFARFPGIKRICLSIHTWLDMIDDDDCNPFRRCKEYHEKYNLEQVVVRVTPEVSAKVCKAYDRCHWPEGRNIVQFRLWDIKDMSPDDAVAQEFTDGTWRDWLDFPGVLGTELSLESLRHLVKTDHLTNAIGSSSGGFLAPPPPVHQPTLAIATKIASCIPLNTILPSIHLPAPIRC